MEKINFKEELFREYELKRAVSLERKNEETKKASLSLLQFELVDPSPDPLLRIVSDRACVGEYDIRLFYVFSQDVSRILQD